MVIALFVIKTSNVIMDTAAYWHKSAFLFGASVDYGKYMTMERFH